MQRVLLWNACVAISWQKQWLKQNVFPIDTSFFVKFSSSPLVSFLKLNAADFKTTAALFKVPPTTEIYIILAVLWDQVLPILFHHTF